ncbi:hypothetical protein AcV7_008720 [Taiwanofungus camphoratus]|nr:hypothetical protein AcV7_008720 [Antrodia cinnamomea]
MSGSSRHGRTLSPPLSATSYSYAATAGQQKLNVVTRLAIEGKSKKGWDGASIKMYLKISLPLDNITPGATIALFPEENLKILDSQVHPLDSNSVPYNFSSTTCPLLHKAARALNLPARSSTSYVSLADSISSSSASIPPLEDKYTGHILVSGYHVSYVLPKEFPRKESDGRSRRGSSMMHFMAAVDIWVPFLSRPPHAPFLLSIPVPRCLSNHIRLRIFPPGQASTASSLASLSSADEDGGAWELTSDPHVTRSQSARLSRSYSYNHFADDESSDASTSAGFAEGCGIQGSFPSTERIRVRWAAPMKAAQIPEAADGRRRVGIREVKGDMTCVVLDNAKGKGKARSDGVMMKLEYNASCKGVWFPGVATLLGMDVGLDAGDCDIAWVPGMEPKWTITGGAGFTGFAIGGPPQTNSRQSSADPPSIYVLPSSPDARGVLANGHLPSRSNSTNFTASATSASLLRAPLPAQTVADYSFESSSVSTPTGTVSSLASLPAPSSPERRRRSRATSLNGRYPETDTNIDAETDFRPPRAPITVHLNMNELLPPSKNVFTFGISGTVLVTPRHHPVTPDSRRSSPSRSFPSDSETDPDPIVLPKFHVFSTDRESVATIVRSEAAKTAVDVYNQKGDLRDGRTLKTALSKGNQVVCGTDGARISLRPSATTVASVTLRSRDTSEDSGDISYNRTRLTNGVRHVSSSSRLRETSMMSTAKLQPRRDGQLMIPFVTATVTPLLGDGAALKDGYAVQICLPAPSDADTEWLEFGLALPSPDGPPSNSGELTLANADLASSPPYVEIASASVEGVPVRFQTSAAAKPNARVIGLRLPFQETSGKEWISWISVHVGHIGGGKVELIYLVKSNEENSTSLSNKEKQKKLVPVPLDVLLPSFALPVGRLEVDVRIQAGFEVSSLQTNLMPQHSTLQGRKLLQYAMGEYFYPRLSLSVVPSSKSLRPSSSFIIKTCQLLALMILSVVVITLLADRRLMTAELHEAKRSLAIYSATLDADYHDAPATITVTTTVVTAGPHRWWPISDTAQVESTASTSPSDTISTSVSSVTIPAVTPTLVSTSTATKPPNEQNALLDLNALVLSWPIRFNLATFKFAESTRATVDVVLRGMGVVWHLCRKVLHYPLDPP